MAWVAGRRIALRTITQGLAAAPDASEAWALVANESNKDMRLA